MPENGIFRSFIQAGFECSTHKNIRGRRLDMVASTEHDRLVDLDYQRLADMGMRTAREGVRWHLIEQTPGQYDFSSVIPILDAARERGIQVIWDILHFGWPEHLDIFEPEWVTAFESFARAFVQVLSARVWEAPLIAPVNEVSFMAWAGGDTACINPFSTGRGAELKKQLVRGFLAAARVIRQELPAAKVVSPEPAIHIIGDPKRPDDVRQAEEYRSAMFESWDMILGVAQPELGGDPSAIDIIGINFYDRNQWWNHGNTIFRGEPEYRPFRDILAEIYDRYRRPCFVAETGTEDAARPDWFAYVCEETRAAIQAKVDVQGICLYPILNHPGWDDDRHCCNGLWDYPGPGGSREIYEPLAAEIRRQNESGWKVSIEQDQKESNATHESRSGLSVSPPVGLCLPASPASDESLCPPAPGVLYRGTGL